MNSDYSNKFDVKLVDEPMIYFSDDLVVKDYDGFISVNKTNSFEELFSYKKHGGVRFLFRGEGQVYFRDNASVFDKGDIYALDLSSGEVKFIRPSNFSLAVPLKGGKKEQYFYSGAKEIFKLDSCSMEEFNISLLCQLDFPSGLPLVAKEKFVVFGYKGQIKIFSHCGNLIFESSLNKLCDIYVFDKIDLTECSRVCANLAICQINPHTLVALDLETFSIKWVSEFAAKNQWEISEDGTIYSVVDGVFKKHSVSNGKLIYECEVKLDDGTKDLNLFKIGLSSNFVWCGFHGRGVCALCRDTGKVVWHEFDGYTCNNNFKLSDDWLNVELKWGGVGIENRGKKNLILTGDL